MQIVKRNGEKQEFNFNKIENALNRAFQSVQGTDADIKVVDYLKEILPLKEDMTVEEIQETVEDTLMQFGWLDVARAYIRYRFIHEQQRTKAEKNIWFIDNFIKSDNTANATIDDNSNVSNHNIAVVNAEIHKEDNQITNYRILENELQKLYPDFDHKQLMRDLNSIMYLHDSSSQIGMPYCVAITMYPFLLHGIKELGGLSAKPESLESFCGIFINMVFAIASQFKGAVATPGFLLAMNWFCEQEWGINYYQNFDKVVSYGKKNRTIKDQILQYFQQITYSINQPAVARGGQSVFWNISIFDKTFYDTMYANFYFPDKSQTHWESFNVLQKLYLHWLNQERLKCILTFPVVSVALIYKDHGFVDQELFEYTCQEYAEGNSFFTYINDSPESLSSCCRLSSKIAKPQFNFTNGQIGEMTGSKNVITLNLNRIIQDCNKNYSIKQHGGWKENITLIKNYLITILDRVYKYQTAYNSYLTKLYDAGLLTAYNAGFIDLKKQYLTIGINGLNQAAEFLGIACNKNEDYKLLCNLIFNTIKEQNLAHKTKDIMFNTEFTP